MYPYRIVTWNDVAYNPCKIKIIAFFLYELHNLFELSRMYPYSFTSTYITFPELFTRDFLLYASYITHV